VKNKNIYINKYINMCRKCNKQHKRFKNGRFKKTCPGGQRGKGLRSMMKQQKKIGAQRKREKAELARYRAGGKGRMKDWATKHAWRLTKKYGRSVWNAAKAKNAAKKKRKKHRGY